MRCPPVDCTTLQVLAGLRTADQLKMKFSSIFSLFTTEITTLIPYLRYMYIMIMMGRLRNLNRYSSLTVHDGAVTGSSRFGHMVIMIAII